MSVSCSPDVFVWHQENKKTHRANHREMSHCSKKNLVGGSLFEMKNAVPDVDESDNSTSEEATLSDKRS